MFAQGQQIGTYTLLSKLGRGGFGEVWLAERRSQFLTKKVAIKLPHDDQVDFEAVRREAELWEQASGHPNVLPIIDADVYDGQVVIVSEYADGGSLSDKLKREGNFSVRTATEMTRGILAGLDFLHSKQIIHRDIKPQNILIQGNTPRLADFGISRAMSATAMSSVVVGTDSYMAPEAFDGKRNVQTDVWSVGVVFYQMLKGSLPFPQDHPSERMFAVLTKEFAPLPVEIPDNFRHIVLKALSKDVAHRYRSASEMLADIQAALSNTTLPSLKQNPFDSLPGEQETMQRSFRPQDLPPTMPIDRVRHDLGPSAWQHQQRYNYPVAPVPRPYPYSRSVRPASIIPRDGSERGNSKALAGFCYLGNIICPVGLILSVIAIFNDKTNTFARFHGFQSLFLSLIFIGLFVVQTILLGNLDPKRSNPIVALLGALIGFGYLGLICFWIFGAIQGFRGKISKIPFIGTIAENWAIGKDQMVRIIE